MNVVAQMSKEERAELFEATSTKSGLPPAAVEKDFWVCWLLKQIFEKEELAERLLFKGGTSLSKCFGLIERFSEDIDLILDWTLLTDENPYDDRSNRKQDIFNKAMQAKGESYIRDVMVPDIDNLVAEHCTVAIHSERPRSILVTYPKAFSSTYIKPEVELEFGAMSAMVPNSEFSIQPYCVDVAPDLFEEPTLMVRAIEAKKTFWDKVTILHVEAHRAEDRPQPARYSRHYYDLYQMINSPIQEEAMADLSLLSKVIAFKAKFYPQGWANFEGAAEGSIKLVPEPHMYKNLVGDYEQMKEMIFGSPPTFDEIMKTIGEFEKRLKEAL